MSDSTPAANMTTYSGNCHCGAVRYNVNTESLDTQQVARCNCSICTRNGYLLIYVLYQDFTFREGYGEEHLKTYQFGSKRATHKFCDTCGSSVFVDFTWDGQHKLALNVSQVALDDYLLLCPWMDDPSGR